MMVTWFSWQADVWLMSELSGVVYMMKRMGPRTEPWGTPQERGSEDERLSRQETEKTLLLYLVPFKCYMRFLPILWLNQKLRSSIFSARGRQKVIFDRIFRKATTDFL